MSTIVSLLARCKPSRLIISWVVSESLFISFHPISFHFTFHKFLYVHYKEWNCGQVVKVFNCGPKVPGLNPMYLFVVFCLPLHLGRSTFGWKGREVKIKHLYLLPSLPYRSKFMVVLKNKDLTILDFQGKPNFTPSLTNLNPVSERSTYPLPTRQVFPLSPLG